MYETTIYSPSAPGGIQVESRWKAPYLSSSFASSLSFKPHLPNPGSPMSDVYGRADRRLTWHFLMKYLWILWSIWFVISHDFWCHIVYLYLSDFQIQTISKLLTSSHLQQHIFASSQLHDTFCLSPMAHGSHLVIWSGVTAGILPWPHGSASFETWLEGSLMRAPVHWTVCMYYIIYIYYMIHILFSALVQVACETKHAQKPMIQTVSFNLILMLWPEVKRPFAQRVVSHQCARAGPIMPHPTAPCLNEGVAVWRIQRCTHVGGNHPATLIPAATDPLKAMQICCLVQPLWKIVSWDYYSQLIWKK